MVAGLVFFDRAEFRLDEFKKVACRYGCFFNIELLTTGMRLILGAGPGGIVGGRRAGSIRRRLDIQLGQSLPHNFPHNVSNHVFVSHQSLSSPSSCSMESTTPTIALSIAAPASPVEAVEADQPSWTTITMSPSPASTESSASIEAPRGVPSGLIGWTSIMRASP